MNTPTVQPTQFTAVQNSELQKSQCLRLLDVLVLGPFLIVAAAREKNPYFKAGLTAAGIATIIYNGRNYLANRRL